VNVLVTGGAGYIGSHTVKALVEAGHHVVVFDDLSTGHRASVAGVPFVQGDVTRREDLLDALKRYSIDAVMHFAAKSLVGESMQDPAKYYVNNVAGGVTLLEALREAGVETIIFSSTAAVYGEPESIPIPEEHPLRPTSVYGRTKLMFEQMLEDYRRVYGLRYAALRYFNAAGADPGGQIGEDHDPETHLIPIVLQAALGQREAVTIFGTDYDTPDGTCIRDYIHVTDLADAHVLALEALKAGGPGGVYNLGNGNGFSVRQVIEAAERVVGAKIPVKEGDRRAGDPAVLVASSEKARRELGWKPRFTDLDEIVRTAWQWHRSHPNGYARPS
jgi:UDP-glucose-4-epimerase